MARKTSILIAGEALRDLRERRGLSVADLARKIGGGRHPQSIRRLETAQPPKRASRPFAHQIARALGADISEFTIPEPLQSEEAAA